MMLCSSTVPVDNKNSRERRTIVFPPTDEDSADEEFAIDENDYHAIREIVLESGHRYDTIENHVQKLVGLKNDEERRVNKLRYTLNFPHVSNYQMVTSSIGKLKKLTNLTHLDLGVSDIIWLPPTIGQLRNLQELDLSFTVDLSTLPEEIGDLSSLSKLNLNCSGINSRSFPSSIGRLSNLTELDLSYTENLMSLPEVIGDLSSLQKLDLDGSAITSLPPSIGRLQNLKDLYLQWTEKLPYLPHEIGDLTSLNTLDLRHSDIRSLPPSIVKLQKLIVLDVGYTKHMNELPEEVGNLANLQILGVSHSGITTKPLPGFLGKLKNLMRLNVFGHAIAHRNNEFRDLVCLQKDSLMILTQDCPLLGSLCVGVHANLMGFANKELGELRYALACNRARSRTGFGRRIKYNKTSIATTPKLWPLVICSAAHAYDTYSFNQDYSTRYNYSGEEEVSCIPKPDAIYQLLVDGRESFIGVLLVNRQQQSRNNNGFG